nr:hypothetical protein Iba_chr04cCG14720 [Ipomoea batatas]
MAGDGCKDGSKKPLPIPTKAPPQANQLPMVEGQDWSSEGEFEEEDKVDENGESSNEDDGEQGKGCSESKETKGLKTQLVNCDCKCIESVPLMRAIVWDHLTTGRTIVGPSRFGPSSGSESGAGDNPAGAGGGLGMDFHHGVMYSKSQSLVV